ncbi:peptidylprolyl isomerase [uncultured Methanoregula sp.]|uniref:peptidylprolyl isomerase n=1 Tax=uncultured Methanoregula sp. TaxID=1005933 RepID=UPI002AAB5834|nr:peptidylprolyl isomerase [uncultured Methanoregula sp.]
MSSPVRTTLLACALIAVLLLAAGCTQQTASPSKTEPAGITGTPGIATAAATPPVTAAATVSTESWKRVRLSTNMGDIIIALNPDMPVTTGNFETLVTKGFYNNVTFHRVIDGFMIQGGDPTGTGMGGPGYTIKDEFKTGNRNDRGTISMANAGPNTGGSQFFINLVNNNYLDTMHPVFGKVVTGMDVVDKIGKVPTTGGQENRPIQSVTILKAEIIS